MIKTNKILVFLAIIFILVILAFGWLTGQKTQEQDNVPAEKINITLFIQDFTDSDLNIEIGNGSNILNVLETLNKKNPALNLKSKSYEGLGVMVEQLGYLVNGQDNKYWQYFINSEQPMLSVDKYILQNNDKIEWLFKESEF